MMFVAHSSPFRGKVQIGRAVDAFQTLSVPSVDDVRIRESSGEKRAKYKPRISNLKSVESNFKSYEPGWADFVTLPSSVIF